MKIRRRSYFINSLRNWKGLILCVSIFYILFSFLTFLVMTLFASHLSDISTFTESYRQSCTNRVVKSCVSILVMPHFCFLLILAPKKPYTDDTAMTRCIAQSFLNQGCLDEKDLAKR